MSQDDRDRLGITTVGAPPTAEDVDARRRIREMGGAAAAMARLDKAVARAARLDEYGRAAWESVRAWIRLHGEAIRELSALRAAGEAMAVHVEAARDATRQALGACGYADACDDELDALDTALARWREVAGTPTRPG